MADQPKSTNGFTSRPPKDQMKTKYDLYRCGEKGLGPVTILSHDVVGHNLHFAGGRTRPCLGEGKCEICTDDQLPRWRGYLFAMSAKGGIGAVEVTPAAMDAIDKHFRANRTLRGSKLMLRRKNGKANGELWAELTPAPRAELPIPKAPSLKKFLAAMWQMKEISAETSKAEKPRVFKPQNGPDFGEEVA